MGLTMAATMISDNAATSLRDGRWRHLVADLAEANRRAQISLHDAFERGLAEGETFERLAAEAHLSPEYLRAAYEQFDRSMWAQAGPDQGDAFLAHFEKRKVSIGTCARAFGTPCVHEHACVRCSLLRPDPAQRARLVEIRDNLLARIAEAEREGWLGEVEGLQVSLAGAEEKLAQLDNLIARRNTTVNVGMPSFPGIGRHVTAGPQAPTHARPKAHNVGDLGSWRTS